MGRYDLAINKKGKNKSSVFISAPDTIADDIQKNQTSGNPNDVTGAQTAIRGKNLLIRGPSGYQVSIPLRFVSITQHDGYELRLELTYEIARGLAIDLEVAQNDPNERLRSGDLEERRRSSDFEEQRRRAWSGRS
jgi:hypothetical protein